MDSYSSNSGSYSEFWRSSPELKPSVHELSRSPLELSVNTAYPVTTIEFESVPNVFTFSPCGPPYKEFAVYKEKSPQDIADALLSLKHAVVRPQLSGQLSPLSPTMHITQNQLGSGPTNLSCQPSQISYTMSPNSQISQYPSPPPPPPQYGIPQYHSESLTPPHNQSQHNMFPAMSVNVSMSMNVGMSAAINNGQYHPMHHHHQHWGGQQQPPTRAMTPQYQHAQYNMAPLSPQYNYPPSHAPYPLTPELRPMPPCEGRNIFYRTPDNYKDAARFCAVSHWKRNKFCSSRHTHMSSPPEPNKVNLCRICGKTYARPSTLKTHLRTHSGEKPYKCSTCNKSFSQAANLTAHLRTHSGEKPFRCPICDRRFSQSSSVTTHMRTHSGERPYRCRLCKKAFSDSSTLTKHLRIHSGEKPYQCKLCLLRFSQSGNLNRHMRVHSNTA